VECGMSAYRQAVGCVVSVPRRSSGVAPLAGLCARVRACAGGAAESLHSYIYTLNKTNTSISAAKALQRAFKGQFPAHTHTHTTTNQHTHTHDKNNSTNKQPHTPQQHRPTRRRPTYNFYLLISTLFKNRVRVRVNPYMHMISYTCIHTDAHSYVSNIYIAIYTCPHTYTHTHVCMSICVYTYLYMSICVYVCVHVYIYVCVYIYIYIGFASVRQELGFVSRVGRCVGLDTCLGSWVHPQRLAPRRPIHWFRVEGAYLGFQVGRFLLAIRRVAPRRGCSLVIFVRAGAVRRARGSHIQRALRGLLWLRPASLRRPIRLARDLRGQLWLQPASRTRRPTRLALDRRWPDSPRLGCHTSRGDPARARRGCADAGDGSRSSSRVFLRPASRALHVARLALDPRLPDPACHTSLGDQGRTRRAGAGDGSRSSGRVFLRSSILM